MLGEALPTELNKKAIFVCESCNKSEIKQIRKGIHNKKAYSSNKMRR